MKKVEICPNTGKRKVYTVNKETSKTDQQWKEHCDVNYIMDRFAKTGQINHLAKRTGQYADVSGVHNLHESLCLVRKAEEEFKKQPAKVRARFHNNLEEMYEFLQDPRNDEEAVALGLKTWPKVADKPVPVAKPDGNQADRRGKSPKPKEGSNGPDGDKRSGSSDRDDS